MQFYSNGTDPIQLNSMCPTLL